MTEAVMTWKKRFRKARNNKDWKYVYERYMKSEHWLETRAILLDERGRSCERCGVSGTVFQIHHKHYRTIGAERRQDVEIVCCPCHKKADKERSTITRMVAENRRWDNRVKAWMSAGHDYGRDEDFEEAEQSLIEYIRNTEGEDGLDDVPEELLY